jgi:molybdate transport system regulatory protein
MRIKLRFECGNDFRLGPGKIELLEQIDRLGSIAAAGRAMGMSYKRAWSLIEEMNEACVQPVILPQRGGAGHGGAALTEGGRALVVQFRKLEAFLDAPTARLELSTLTDLLKPGLGAAEES